MTIFNHLNNCFIASLISWATFIGVGSGRGRNDTLRDCLLGPEIFAGQKDVRPT